MKGFPGGSAVKILPANAGRRGFDPWVRKIPWGRKWKPIPVFLLWKSRGQRSLVDGFSKSQIQLSNYTTRWNLLVRAGIFVG